MPFLTPDDYGVQIRQEQLDIVLADAPADAQLKAELAAQEFIEGYLAQRYDVAAIFSATGDERSELLVLYMVDLTLYTLHSRHGRVAMPAKRLDRYDQAVAWLRAVGAGKVAAQLPALPVAEAAGRFKWGSEPQQNNYTW